MSQKLDAILFGASGVTGKHAIPVLEKFSRTKCGRLTWGIAGRSEEKLKSVLNDCEGQTGLSFGNIPLIIANVYEEQTIRDMVHKTRILINCCGPYHFYGEPVVKACVEEGTHYVDVSVEVHFIEKMQLKYHKKAQERGIYIISACGLESIPVDLGIVHLQQNFTGTLNSVVSYFNFWEEGDQSAVGSAVSYASWETMICGLANKKEVKKIRCQLFPNPSPVLKPKSKPRKFVHKSALIKKWATPMHFSDVSAVERTQRYFSERHSKRPIQVQTYHANKSFLVSVLLYLHTLLTTFLAKFNFGRKLMLKVVNIKYVGFFKYQIVYFQYPEELTAGLISRKLPNENRLKSGRCKFTLYGEGWKDVLPNAKGQYASLPNRAIVAEIKASDPSYGATNICLVLAARTVITETDKMPPTGGVYSPGYAFANTSLMKQLNENDISFDILYEKNL